MDPRLQRRRPEVDARSVPVDVDAALVTATEGAFRVDLERIRFSPYFSRLAAVTQVITPGVLASFVNNRLTHTVKVTSVARAIASGIRTGEQAALAAELGGCDPVVVQAAASAHDLGHPPFGHLGELALDRLARSRFGLADGFEGNAQTFRILAALDVHGPEGNGLNLTAAVRAAVLKYPWARFGYPDPHPSQELVGPKGSGPGEDGAGAGKFSAYVLDVPELTEVLAAYPRIVPWRQTAECSVMDVADDIAYSLHDLDDFHRAGVLQHAAIAAEFRTWRRNRAEFAAADDADLLRHERRPGRRLELQRRRMSAKDAWIFDDEVFSTAVGRIAGDLVDGLLAVPFDGSMDAERAVEEFTASWIAHLQDSVVVQADPHPRSAHVRLDRQAWHEVAVLKFVHQRFVLDRPDLAGFQRGQAQAIGRLVAAYDSWLADPVDGRRAPRRLVDLVELATAGYRRIARTDRRLLVSPTGEITDGTDDLIRLGRGRGIIDFIASFTDAEAARSDATLGGSSGQMAGLL
ncbi:dGTP triphosphohydrolase [Nakamurella sp. A5-74]|uniref:dGTP triphosphohydrolase n=1 Tax=Nakamurella sp. A5-74 TaxID=3158264 RepID=A0AAU8DLT0_9ACTN